MKLYYAGIGHKQNSKAGNVTHIVALCWVHSVIGWGFFILQSWIPTYLNSLGMTDIRAVGLLSALPWVVSHHSCAAFAIGGSATNVLPCLIHDHYSYDSVLFASRKNGSAWAWLSSGLLAS